ncbi:MAG: DNA polymerase III subunit gamma/tau, partial [Cyanobacteria bacterium P01_H01_bin.153]
YEPLHHKYRPQTFTELVGQDAIAQTLSRALEQQRIAPAYLFCGPRGTGKTSSARILAKSLNCLSHPVPSPQPCGECEVCRGISSGSILDIVEIDAASNTGVDNIRELIERAQFAPVQCRYKVYVVDECHMLSTAAFNALLKTLEEPPEQVIFVLATTDPQRVLPTIISRCQRFDFRRIPLEAMVNHLQAIARQETIDITEDAVRLVAQIAQGGLRDAQSLLDQLSLLAPPISAEKVWDLVGAVPERDLLALVQAIAADDGVTTLDTVRRLMDRGREPIIVLQNLAGFYRDLTIAKTAGGRADLVPVTPPTWAAMTEFSRSLALPLLLAGQKTLREAEIQLRNTTQPRLWLEVTLMNLLPSAQAVDAAAALNQTPALPVPVISPATPAASPAAPTNSTTKPPAPVPGPSTLPPVAQPAASSASPNLPPPVPAAPATTSSPEPSPAVSQSADSSTSTDLVALWAQLITLVKPMGTRALLQQQGHLIGYDGRAARVGIRSQNLLKMAQSKLPNIEAAFQQLLNQSVKVSLEVADAPPVSATPPAPPPPAPSGSLSPARQVAAPPTSLPTVPPSTDAFNAKPPPATAAPPLAETPGPTHDWQPQSDLDRAAKSFAEFFNGQVVDPDQEEDDSDQRQQSSKKPQGSTKPPLKDDNVPF